MIDYFLGQYINREKREFRLQPSTLRMLEAYGWPGNVRELKGVMGYAVSMTDGTNISPKSLPFFFHSHKALSNQEPIRTRSRDFESEPPQDFNLKNAVSRFEKKMIQDTLARWPNRTDAIKALGISRRSFYMKLKEYNIT